MQFCPSTPSILAMFHLPLVILPYTSTHKAEKNKRPYNHKYFYVFILCCCCCICMIHNLAAFGNFLWGVLWGSSFGLSVGRLVDWSTRLYSTIVRLNFFLVCSVRRSPYWGFCLSLRIGRGCAGYIGCGGTVFLLLLFFCCFSFCLPRILKTNTRKVQPYPISTIHIFAPRLPLVLVRGRQVGFSVFRIGCAHYSVLAAPLLLLYTAGLWVSQSHIKFLLSPVPLPSSG